MNQWPRRADWHKVAVETQTERPAVDAKSPSSGIAHPGSAPGVVAASVYANGKRVATDIAIDDAGEWSKRPGHVVAIGLFEPGLRPAGPGAGAVRSPSPRHRRRRQAAPASEARAIRRGAVHRRADVADRRRADRLRRNPHLRRARIRCHRAPRRFELVCAGTGAMRVLSYRPLTRPTLYPLLDPRFHRRQLHAGGGDDSRRGRRDRGSGLRLRAQQSRCATPLHAAPRPAAAAQRRCTARQCLPPPRARGSDVDRSGDAAAVPRRDRSRAPRAGGDRRAARGSGVRVRSEPDERPSRADQHYPPPGGLGRHSRGADRDRRHLRHELRIHARAQAGLRLFPRSRRDCGHLHHALHAPAPLRLALSATLARARAVILEHAQLAHRQLVDLERLQACLLHRHAAEGEPADRQRAHRDGTERRRTDRQRDHADGGNGFGAADDFTRHRRPPSGLTLAALRRGAAGLSIAAVMYHPRCKNNGARGNIMPVRSALSVVLLASGALLAASVDAGAQTYPDRPIKIVVPVGPAGSYDIVGRLLADQLSKRLGQSVVVENRPGAGTVVGTQAVINSPPDGYTLLVGGLSNIVFNAGLYQKLSYDPLNDLVPVALVFNISYTLVGYKNLPYSTPKEVIAAAKANPGALKLANAGTGTGQHILGAAFMRFTGTKFLEVPYRGSAAAFPDLLAGRVDLFVDSTPAALPYVKSGQAKGIAILSSKRSAQMPDVPTMTESGVPN